MEVSGDLAIFPIRRDERGQCDGSTISKQLGHFTNSADVFTAVGGRETKVLIQSEADVVAVEQVG
jgi:hypothetical protein